MAADTTTEQVRLEEAAHAYLASLKPAAQQGAQPEVLKFVRWCGVDRDLAEMRGHEIAQYAENFPPTVSDAAKRADFVRAFLKWAKERGITETNLGTHLRVRKANKPSANAQTLETQPIYLTREGHDDLVKEMEDLKERRPRIQADLARAMADKDFRENAPLDAARDTQGQLEARIRELEGMLRHAVVVENVSAAPGDAARVGCSVVLANLNNGSTLSYQLVNAAEARQGSGRLSVESPVGQAIVGRHVGDEVQVTAPSGIVRFRIERVEH